MNTFNTQTERSGKTYKFTGPTKLYITVNRDFDGVIREVFVNAASSGSTVRSLCEALGKLISLTLQHRKELINTLVKKFSGDLSESQWRNTQFPEPAKSIPDAISMVLKLELGEGYD